MTISNRLPPKGPQPEQGLGLDLFIGFQLRATGVPVYAMFIPFSEHHAPADQAIQMRQRFTGSHQCHRVVDLTLEQRRKAIHRPAWFRQMLIEFIEAVFMVFNNLCQTHMEAVKRRFVGSTSSGIFSRMRLQENSQSLSVSLRGSVGKTLTLGVIFGST